jgi:hypothetical protein
VTQTPTTGSEGSPILPEICGGPNNAVVSYAGMGEDVPSDAVEQPINLSRDLFVGSRYSNAHMNASDAKRPGNRLGEPPENMGCWVTA